jgi:hypothetical protein
MLHQRLKSADNAACYNSIAGSDNKIEKMSSQAKSSPPVLKTRIQEAYRKFFYYIITDEDERRECSEEGWAGQFNRIKNIHVFNINKHKYKP